MSGKRTRVRLFRRSHGGFSLIEVLISVFIVGVTIILFQTALQGVFLVRIANHKEIALRIANNKMEYVRALPYASLPTSGTFSDSQMSSIPSGSGTLTVANFNSKVKQVTAAVTWVEPHDSMQRSVSISTLITEIGGI